MLAKAREVEEEGKRLLMDAMNGRTATTVTDPPLRTLAPSG
jgi:hypothetical protein